MDRTDLKKAGLKVTLPRVKILNILAECDKHHLSAEEIYQQLVADDEEVGLATVYRVLTQFEMAGLVIRHRFDEDHSVFELSHDDHHDHFVCVHCNRIEEFVDDVIEERQRVIADNLGFRITHHSLYLYGECKKIDASGNCGKCGKNIQPSSK